MKLSLILMQSCATVRSFKVHCNMFIYVHWSFNFLCVFLNVFRAMDDLAGHLKWLRIFRVEWTNIIIILYVQQKMGDNCIIRQLSAYNNETIWNLKIEPNIHPFLTFTFFGNYPQTTSNWCLTLFCIEMMPFSPGAN